MAGLDQAARTGGRVPHARRLFLGLTAALAAAFMAFAGSAVAAAGTTGISNSSPVEVPDGTILGLPAVTAASGSLTDTYFVCPSVSTNNKSGMWVIGHHGGYYVLVPTQGLGGSKVFINIPTHVANQAQIPAGWALYNSLPSYPNFVGTATLLQEGIDGWLGSPAGWQEGDMASVVDNGNGSYTVTNQRLGQSVTIDHSIPLASAAVW
jgi:hypothetical protein